MAWTDLSNAAPDDSIYTNLPDGTLVSSTGIVASSTIRVNLTISNAVSTVAYSTLSQTFNIPGYDGFQPAGTPSPITNNLNEGGGGGGSTRPTSGFLYPRGQG